MVTSRRGPGFRRPAGLVAAVFAAGLLLSGCVVADGPPSHTFLSKGEVQVQTAVTAAPDIAQQLNVAGVYYSTDSTALISIVGTSATGASPSSFAVPPSVQVATIPASGGISPNQSGLLSATLKGLKPATTYSYRFFTAGSMDIPMMGTQPAFFALKMGQFKTVSAGTVGNPVAPQRMYPGRAVTIYGSLQPRHPSGTSPMRIYKWKRTPDNKWQAFGYTWAKAKNYSSYSRYYKSMSFAKGTWRLRALHPAHENHGSLWSPGFDYVSVR